MYMRVEWTAPPASPQLAEGEVHVWQMPLESALSNIADLIEILSPDELERSRRFHFEKDRRHYVLCRHVLRTITGRYLQRKPDTLTFSYSARGKPQIQEGGDERPIHFSLSHSHEMALFSFARDRRNGIDVEHIRIFEDVEGLARRFFSPQESDLLRKTPDDQKLELFFTIWTAKEAYLKATGEGLSGLEDIEVAFSRDMSCLRLKHRHDTDLFPEWSAEHFCPQEGYLAALVLEHDFAVKKMFFRAEDLLHR